ncbi:MAG: hypothetical protein BWY74_01301 [Firmicutes bacterium ADurb.Bin419]|nr:MAG: hypothetical protein BWY74_01301 [Firmicutes bacterium ADurb.Bin419]
MNDVYFININELSEKNIFLSLFERTFMRFKNKIRNIMKLV